MSFLTMSDGVKLFFEDSGEGETLIFIHGLNSSHGINQDFYDQFKGQFRVVLYDQRAHGQSDRFSMHMNVKRLGEDLNEIIEALMLDEVTLIGHSMGAATIYSYVNQFGCGKVKRIVASDMSPYMRNDGWKGGIAQGQWSDDDFLDDMDRIFDDVGNAAFHITKNIMDRSLLNLNPDEESVMIKSYRENTDAFTMASLWYSLFRTDQRPAMEKVTVPFLYVMPENPLYSMEAIDYIKTHVKGKFVLENDFSGTTHAIWRQKPREVADAIKSFIDSF